MFELSVEAEFCAAHALLIAGQREPVHGHNWRLTVTVAGPALDRDELLLDFHALEAVVQDVIGPFRNADLNAVPPFDRVNPSAEAVARHIAEAVQRGLERQRRNADPPYRVSAVRVTEAPGCAVVYRP
jgi:6-pyruvoyltetrahydropterin/6-carboxytetrahydropterin synthase